MKIVDNITPHVWNYHLSVLPGSPWTDVRLRKALKPRNRSRWRGRIDERSGQTRQGQVDPSSPWFGKPSFELKYDVREAKKAGAGSRLLQGEAAEGDLEPIAMPILKLCCRNSLIGNDRSGRVAQYEVAFSGFSLSSRLPAPAFLASATSYLSSKLGLPNHGLDGRPGPWRVWPDRSSIRPRHRDRCEVERLAQAHVGPGRAGQHAQMIIPDMRGDVVDDLHAGGLSCGTASGAGVSIRSTWPASNALVAGQRFRHRDQDQSVGLRNPLLVSNNPRLGEFGRVRAAPAWSA